jgi:hypothetical protein
MQISVADLMFLSALQRALRQKVKAASGRMIT